MAQSEYRIIVTATFDGSGKRDAAYSSLKTTLQTWKAGLAGAAQPKRMDMTRDDYIIADAPTVTEPVT